MVEEHPSESDVGQGEIPGEEHPLSSNPDEDGGNNSPASEHETSEEKSPESVEEVVADDSGKKPEADDSIEETDSSEADGGSPSDETTDSEGEACSEDAGNEESPKNDASEVLEVAAEKPSEAEESTSEEEEKIVAPTVNRNDSPFITCNFSTIGLGHVQKGMPCQDSSVCFSGKDYAIAIVADGHSDFHCLRSDKGSKLVTEECLEYLQSTIDVDGLKRFLDDVERDPNGVLIDLWRNLIKNWRIAVKRYDSDNPVTEDEWAALKRRLEGKFKNPQEVDEAFNEVKNEDIFTRYGSTAQIAIQHEGGAILLVLGDGESIVVRCDGSTYNPIPHDIDTEGSETHSICEPEAIKYCKYFVINEPVIGIGVCCDGISSTDVTSDNQYMIGEYLKELFKEVITESDGWENRFCERIIKYSNNSPHDDSSISFILSKDCDVTKLEKEEIPLVYHDEPVYDCIRKRWLLGSRTEYAYFVNAYDETAYKSEIGQKLMLELLEKYCSQAFKDVSDAPADQREDVFYKSVRVLIHQWNRKATTYDNEHPDTTEENKLRLSNHLLFLNDPEKYALSLAVSLTVDEVTYISYIGRGNAIVDTGSGNEVLGYGDLGKSTATISFSQIRRTAVKKPRSVYLVGASEVEPEIKLI